MQLELRHCLSGSRCQRKVFGHKKDTFILVKYVKSSKSSSFLKGLRCEPKCFSPSTSHHLAQHHILINHFSFSHAARPSHVSTHIILTTVWFHIHRFRHIQLTMTTSSSDGASASAQCNHHDHDGGEGEETLHSMTAHEFIDFIHGHEHLDRLLTREGRVVLERLRHFDDHFVDDEDCEDDVVVGEGVACVDNRERGAADGVEGEGTGAAKDESGAATADEGVGAVDRKDEVDASSSSSLLGTQGSAESTVAAATSSSSAALPSDDIVLQNHHQTPMSYQVQLSLLHRQQQQRRTSIGTSVNTLTSDRPYYHHQQQQQCLLGHGSSMVIPPLYRHENAESIQPNANGEQIESPLYLYEEGATPPPPTATTTMPPSPSYYDFDHGCVGRRRSNNMNPRLFGLNGTLNVSLLNV